MLCTESLVTGVIGFSDTTGCFPLVTNDTTLTDGEVFAAYKYQPNLERRHAQLKGT
jgi:hypothetical protein